MTTTPESIDPDRMLQVRSLDPDVKRAMRIEIATRNITYADLLRDMWRSYRQFSWEQEAEAAAG